MPQISVRFNTQQAIIPMLSQQLGRTIVRSDGDLTFVSGMTPTKNPEVAVDRGVPMFYYAHNVLPTAYGYQAVGYVTEISSAAEGEFFEIFTANGAVVTDGDVSESSLRTYIAVVEIAGVRKLHYISTGGSWTQISNSPVLLASDVVTVAHVNGVSYILVPGSGVYVFDVTGNLLEERTLATLDINRIQGIVASNGYLIVWESNSIAWSSAVDVEDFDPDNSEITGAGAGSVQEATGDIVYIRPNPLGFTIFTTTNIVTVLYTGNDSYPFEFAGLFGSGGIYGAHLTSAETINGNTYAMTTSGIQKVATSGSKTVLVAISDFLGGRIFEDYDTTLDQFVDSQLGHDMETAIEVIANRYIVVSFSKNASGGNFTHAVVVDTIQERIGRLKIDHKQVLEFRDIFVGTFLDSRGNMGFLQSNGTIARVDFDYKQASVEGVLVFGKLQLQHDKLAYLGGVEIENVADSFSLVDLPSWDGKTLLSAITGFSNPDDSGKPIQRYYFDDVAKSHTLVAKGGFDISTMLLSFLPHGDL